jgi:PAS domain S-box-containing protein
MTAEPLRRPEGGAVVTHWDVTTRKVSEMALRESEDRFRVMADALPIAVWLVDTDASCTYLNRVWLETTGRTMEQDAGAGWLDSVHPADRGPTMETFMRAFRARAPFKMEYRLRTRDGRYRWFLDTGVVRSGSDGAFLGYIGGCADIHERMEAERLLRDLSRRLMQAQDDERRRISRELHDHLSQELALLAVQLQQLVVQPPASLDGFIMPLQDAWRRTAEIASDVHGISHRLHPSKMEALGLVATIQAHCRDSSRQGRPVTFRETNVPKISPDRALSLYRVLEEALGNVFRHSGATGAHVTLVGLDHQVVLRVSDDGAGFVNDGEKTAGLGLVSMRERVESLNGRLAIVSVPGSGTVVEARIPLDPARDLRGVESDAPADTASTLRVVAGGRAESA